jgi:hypothetical protein
VIAYVCERLFTAISALATRDAPLRERLANAWREASRLSADDFPSPVRERWQNLETLLYSSGAYVDDVITGMSDDLATKLAQEIVALHEWACHTRGPRGAVLMPSEI